jgi:Ca-activated chloride channel family protein
VEPASIPDVLADRPVILFGKWRGKAEGTILLSGLTGEKPYSDEIRVTSVKPERSNAGLPYLWARHRITLLSDYNLLRQSDERIAEVTNLGLTYNLLTAYTSFIAVDSEVRNQDGRTTTVNQPLPLPEGVSDYAVGGVMSRNAAAPMMMKEKKAFAEPEMLAAKSEDKAARQPAAVPPLSIKISRLSVAGGLGKDAVRSTIEQQLKTLQACFQNVTLPVTIELRLTIGANGVVKNIEIVNSIAKSEAVKQCILQQMKSWPFPAAAQEKDTNAVVTFRISS